MFLLAKKTYRSFFCLLGECCLHHKVHRPLPSTVFGSSTTGGTVGEKSAALRTVQWSPQLVTAEGQETC